MLYMHINEMRASRTELFDHPMCHGRRIAFLWLTLPTMKCRNEYDFVTVMYLVPFLSFKFPVSIVDQDEDTWASRA